MDFWANVPSAVWGAIGVTAAAVFTVGGALVRDWWANRRESKVDAGQLALEYAKGLDSKVARLEARVTVLEGERNAYRSWSHVLWDHIHDTDNPRIPAPAWPTDLPR